MANFDTRDHPDAVEVENNLSDFNAVILQRWRHWVAMIAVIAGLVFGIPLFFDLIDGIGLAHAIGHFEWLPIAVLILFLATLILASNALGYWWGKRKRRIVPTSFLVTDEGIRMANSYGTSYLFWPTLLKVSATGDRLFLFVTPHFAIVLPRRAFQDLSQFDR